MGGSGRVRGFRPLPLILATARSSRPATRWTFALSGDAALLVQTAQGQRLTRDGSLTRSAAGELVQASGGSPVLDDGGRPISLPSNAKTITISPRGDVSADGKQIGTLRLASLAGARKAGDNLFTTPAVQPASANASVRQGYLEASNVSVVGAMVSMIAVLRAYETNQKMAQTEDDATGKAVEEVGKV